MINWANVTNTTDSLMVNIHVYETGCDTSYGVEITLTDNIAPDVAIIERKPNSNILACSDSTIGINYQWGYDEIATDFSTILIGDTLQYVQLSSAPDTNVYRYWVDTYNENCTTRSYYNDAPNPMAVNNYDVDKKKDLVNPVTNYLYFDYPFLNAIDIKVVDILGKEIICDIDLESKTIRFNNLNPGLYMLILESENKEIIKKFIKQ